MHKAKLKNIEPIHFPKKIQVGSLMQGDKIEYIYAARKVSSGHESILEIDFFSLQEKKTVFRVFISKKDFITQSFLTAESKWLNSQLDRLLDVYYYKYKKWAKAVALNGRSVKTILTYLRPKLKNLEFDSEIPLMAVRYFQDKIRKIQLGKKHQKIKERIDSEFVKMDKLPKNIYKWIERYPLYNNQYIFYKREGKYYKGYCSACNSEVWPDYAKHLLPGLCPACGAEITFKASGISKNTKDKFIFSYFQKGVNGSVIQRIYEGMKSYGKGYDRPHVSFSECRRYVYRDGKHEVFHYGNFKNTGEYRWCDGLYANLFGYVFFSDCGSLYFSNLREVLQGTELMDCRLDKFADTKTLFDPLDYLVLYNRQPEIRFLVENGLNNLILEGINSYKAYIKQEVFQILKDYKSFMPLFREIGILAGELELISNFPSKKFIKKDILLRIRKAGITDEFAPVLRYANPVRALNYLEKQDDGRRKMKDILIQWLDYLRFAEFLEYDMNSSFVLFPNKLGREHDRVSGEYGNIAGIKNGEKIALMSDKLNSIYGYENGKFLIRAPKHDKEIKYEGSTLRHCVGGYIDSMAKLDTFILFIREKTDADKPFYTVEFKSGKVRQCHGYVHEPATPEVSAFLDEWKTQMYKKKEQKELAAAA